MAEIHLEVDDRSRLGDLDPSVAYLSGLDLAPWKSTWERSDSGWTLRFSETDSPRLHLPVKLNDDFQVMLSTATMRPGPRPYRLWLEIARGTVDRLRNRVSAWQVLDFVPSHRLRQEIERCSLEFCVAMGQHRDVAACERTAQSLIDQTLEAMDLAAEEYVAWQRDSAAAGSSNSSTLRGVWLDVERGSPHVGTAAQVADALDDLVNTVVVCPCWNEIEARPDQWNWSSVDERLAAANSRPWNVVLGPLLSFQRSAWPEWLLAQTDHVEIRRSVQRWVAKLMERYAGQVDLVILAEKVNLVDGLGWDGPTRLQLVIDAGTTLRRAVDNLPYVVGFTQPFSESQYRGVDYPAFHLADALLRANLEISGFALDFEFGGGPTDTRPRDLCQLIDRLAHWGSFGLPLVVSTSAEERSDAEWVALRAARAGFRESEPAERPASEETTREVKDDGNENNSRTFELSTTGPGAVDWVQPYFRRWLEILDSSGVVDAVFWSHALDSQGSARGLVNRDGEATHRARVFRQAFGLPDPHDTLPLG
ncbi:MAG: hypothetical protein KDA83_07155 [Planctomycetales bacterium]|nr:hypothetical protein [Planctomycetales bacterium]